MNPRIISQSAAQTLTQTFKRLGEFRSYPLDPNDPLPSLSSGTMDVLSRWIQVQLACKLNPVAVQAFLCGDAEAASRCLEEPYSGKPAEWKLENEWGESLFAGPIGKVVFGTPVTGKVVLYKDLILEVDPFLNTEEMEVEVLYFLRQRECDFEFKRQSLKQGIQHPQFVRYPIAEAIRNEVWRRDKGCCTQCGSQMNLEFDHVIPVSKGGSNTARNIQLLCEACNRRKSDSIG